MQNTARPGRGGGYSYHAPADDHEQPVVSVRFTYATFRGATTTRQMQMFNSHLAYGLKQGEAAFVVNAGLADIVEG